MRKSNAARKSRLTAACSIAAGTHTAIANPNGKRMSIMIATPQPPMNSAPGLSMLPIMLNGIVIKARKKTGIT